MEDMSLPSLFEQARKIHTAATESGADQELVRKGCEDMINMLDLFSANETKDDVSTTSFKYFLVPFYLAELTEKIAQDDRIQILKASQAKLKDFLSFCEAMELVPQEELESYKQGAPKSFADQRARKNWHGVVEVRVAGAWLGQIILSADHNYSTGSIDI